MVLGSLFEEAVSQRRRWHLLASGTAVTPSLTALIPRELDSLPAAQRAFQCALSCVEKQGIIWEQG